MSAADPSPSETPGPLAHMSYMSVTAGDSLADTAAQRGVIDIKAFRELEYLLFQKFRLKCRSLKFTLPASGIGGSGKSLASVEWPLGLPGLTQHGLIQMTVLDTDRVPPLTPVGLLRDLKALIDLDNNKITYRNKKLCQGTQKMNVLSSGHVSHSIVDFETPWRRPDPESDKLYRYAPKEKFSHL